MCGSILGSSAQKNFLRHFDPVSVNLSIFYWMKFVYSSRLYWITWSMIGQIGHGSRWRLKVPCFRILLNTLIKYMLKSYNINKCWQHFRNSDKNYLGLKKIKSDRLENGIKIFKGSFCKSSLLWAKTIIKIIINNNQIPCFKWKTFRRVQNFKNCLFT